MDDIDLVNKLTENGKYAAEYALLFLLGDNNYFLEYFDKYDIIGKRLETFIYKCCNEDINTMRTVLLCLDWKLFDLDLVHKNLDQDNPIPFIEETSIPNESHIQCFKRYKETFNKNMQQRNKGR